MALAAAVGVIATFYSGAPAAFAKDAYPPGWNVKTDVPPSTSYTWLGGYNTNLPQTRRTGRIPSRCHRVPMCEV